MAAVAAGVCDLRAVGGEITTLEVWSEGFSTVIVASISTHVSAMTQAAKIHLRITLVLLARFPQCEALNRSLLIQSTLCVELENVHLWPACGVQHLV